MKIAIVGTGIAGLTAAHQLYQQHELTIFEASHYVGGHANTVDVSEGDRTLAIDTGFIVLNDWTYPHFQALLKTINAEVYNSDMSFSVRCESTDFEWCGDGINGLILNRDNWKKLSAYKMLLEIVSFNRLANSAVAQSAANSGQLSLGEFLTMHKFSQAFISYYILPMGAAIWSASTSDMTSYPAISFLRFFKNHGLLSISHQPQWKTIKGGARAYVDKLIAPFKDNIRLNTAIARITRQHNQVSLYTQDNEAYDFDHVFLACHSDQALGLLDTATEPESATLSAIKYQPNVATLHTDSSIMPLRRKAWSSWNYLIGRGHDNTSKVSYYMNRLQNLNTDKDYFVSLNMEERIAEDRICRSINYMHPVFDQAAITAQANFSAINGTDNTWYCGAYWRNGFHEDGVWSGLQAVKLFQQAH